jgi:hypothetical protein
MCQYQRYRCLPLLCHRRLPCLVCISLSPGSREVLRLAYIRRSSVRGSCLSSMPAGIRSTHCEGDAALLLLAMKSSVSAGDAYHAEERRKGRREVISLRRHGVFSVSQDGVGDVQTRRWRFEGDGVDELSEAWCTLS